MKRIVLLALLVVLIFCMSACKQETPLSQIQVGTSERDIYEMGLRDSVLMTRWPDYIFYQDGNDFVVGEIERLGGDSLENVVVKNLTRIKAFKPKKDAYLRLEKGMSIVELVKTLGLPAGAPWAVVALQFKIFDDDNKWVAVSIGLDDTVTSAQVVEDFETVWEADFDQEEAPETDVATTIITVIVSAAVVGGSIGVLLAQYRGKKKEDIEE